MLRRINNITEEDDVINVEFKEKTQKYFLLGFADDNGFSKIKNEITKDQHCTIVLFNTKANLDFVMKNWSDLIKNRKLSIMFFNLFSKTDKMWSVYPATHNYIAEGKGIKTGLNTLFSNVEESTEEELKKIIKS